MCQFLLLHRLMLEGNILLLDFVKGRGELGVRILDPEVRSPEMRTPNGRSAQK